MATNGEPARAAASSHLADIEQVIEGIECRQRYRGVVMADVGPTTMVTAMKQTDATTVSRLDDGTLVQELPACGDVLSTRLSPDEQRVATAHCVHTKACVYDVATGTSLYEVKHAKPVYDAQFSHNGQLLVTASGDKTAKVVDLRTGEVVNTFWHDDKVNTAAFSPDNEYIVTACDDGKSRVWQVQTNTLVSVMGHGDTRVLCAEFSPDGKTIVTACGNGTDGSGTGFVWKSKPGTRFEFEVVAETSHAHDVNTIQVSANGKWVLTSSDDNTWKLWSLRTGELLSTRTMNGNVESAQFSKDGLSVYTVSNETTHSSVLTEWKITTKKPDGYEREYALALKDYEKTCEQRATEMKTWDENCAKKKRKFEAVKRVVEAEKRLANEIKKYRALQ